MNGRTPRHSGMTLAAFLELPAVVRARPELAGSPDIADRYVRWVHTSEIYEIAPLLKGGEVLLTTGLGLVALTPEARRAYVADLARVGVAALALELGRTFHEAPADVVLEARRQGLPLILLHAIVPFIEITEAAHAILIEGELGALRLTVQVTDRLLDALATGAGLTGLVGQISETAGCIAALYLADGELVAGTAPAELADTSEASVLLGDAEWGRLVLEAPDSSRIRAILDAAVKALAIEISRTSLKPLSRHQSGAQLLRDMLTGRYASTGELTARALGAGLVLRPDRKALALCVRSRLGAAGVVGLATVVREAARAVFGPALVAEHGGEVLVATIAPARGLRALLEDFADRVQASLEAAGGNQILVAAGRPVDDIPGLVATLPEARETARLASRLVPSARVVVAADFALYQLLASVVGDEPLEQFVSAQLGPLLAHDARTGAGLVMTLDAYLASGLSKARAAEALGIRRQTLYGRLERISLLLGELDLEDRGRRTALDLALVGWRLRVSAASR